VEQDQAKSMKGKAGDWFVWLINLAPSVRKLASVTKSSFPNSVSTVTSLRLLEHKQKDSQRGKDQDKFVDHAP
jgi:hypothetical protein